jgi:iron complex transport system substrate-binding protein
MTLSVKIISIGLMAIIVFLCLAGARTGGTASAQPIVGQDDYGRTIVMEQAPHRIILLSGSPIDVIYELGAGDLLVGVVDSVADGYPETCRRYPSLLEKERIGRFDEPNIEKIIALDPDLIFTYGSSDHPGRFSAAFEKRGLPYAALASVDNIAFGLAQIRRLGVLLGKEKQAAALADRISAEIEDMAARIQPDPGKKPLVYYWWGSRNGTYGRLSAIHELITLAGGINLTAEFNARYMELSPEYVIAGNPDVILISYWQSHQKQERVAALRARAGFSDIRGVKNNRIHPIDGHSFHTIIRFPEVIQAMAGYFYPDQPPFIQDNSNE